jgi:hypothetical protein
MLRSVLLPHGDVTVDTKSKESLYEYDAPATGPTRLVWAVADKGNNVQLPVV